MYEESKKEKEGMVIKYAMAEQKNIKVQEEMQKVGTNYRCTFHIFVYLFMIEYDIAHVWNWCANKDATLHI